MIWEALRTAETLEEWPRERELSRPRWGWVSHVVPALGLAAGIGMWLGAVVWLLVKMGGGCEWI